MLGGFARAEHHVAVAVSEEIGAASQFLDGHGGQAAEKIDSLAGVGRKVRHGHVSSCPDLRRRGRVSAMIQVIRDPREARFAARQAMGGSMQSLTVFDARSFQPGGCRDFQ